MNKINLVFRANGHLGLVRLLPASGKNIRAAIRNSGKEFLSDLRYDISMSKAEMGFDPKTPVQVVIEAFEYMSNLKNR